MFSGELKKNSQFFFENLKKSNSFQLRQKGSDFSGKKLSYQKTLMFFEKTLTFVVKKQKYVNEYLKLRQKQGQ